MLSRENPERWTTLRENTVYWHSWGLYPETSWDHRFIGSYPGCWIVSSLISAHLWAWKLLETSNNLNFPNLCPARYPVPNYTSLDLNWFLSPGGVQWCFQSPAQFLGRDCDSWTSFPESEGQANIYSTSFHTLVMRVSLLLYIFLSCPSVVGNSLSSI